MIPHPGPAPLRLQALLLADHIYRDQGSGKYVIAGTFHHLNVLALPTTFGRTIGIFVSLSGLKGTAAITLEFVEATTQQVLMQTRSLEISCDDPATPVEFAVEMPPLPLPRPGSYHLRVAADGHILGQAPVSVRALDEGR